MKNKTVYTLCIVISLITAAMCGLIAGMMLATDQTAYFLAFILSAMGNVYNSCVAFDLFRKS